MKGNDVSGWIYSEKGERMPLGWGNDRTYVKGYNIPYVILAQEAMNDYNNLVKAEELLMTVDTYQESEGLPATVFANDLENRIVAVNLSTQWRYTENEAWTSYNESSPDLTGNKTVQLRQGETGTRLASKEPVTFTFTEDNQPDTRKYIPVSHLQFIVVQLKLPIMEEQLPTQLMPIIIQDGIQHGMELTQNVILSLS